MLDGHIQEALVSADAFLTDYTSVTFDIALLRRPSFTTSLIVRFSTAVGTTGGQAISITSAMVSALSLSAKMSYCSNCSLSLKMVVKCQHFTASAWNVPCRSTMNWRASAVSIASPA